MRPSVFFSSADRTSLRREPTLGAEVEMHSTLHRVALLFACVTLQPAPAHAQPTLDRWTGLDSKKLQEIYVRDTGGTETSGRLLRLSPDSLVILAGDVERRFDANEVMRVQKRDSLGNGTLIGLAIGAGMGLMTASISDCPGTDSGGSCGGTRALAVAVSMGVYSAIGAGVDALVHGRTTIYERHGARAAIVSRWREPNTRY